MNVTEFPDLQLAREEASRWVARLDRGLTPGEQEDLRAWRQASPANARALRQLSELWGSMNVMKALATMFPDSPQEEPAALVTARKSGRPAAAAVAAGIVLVVALAGSASWYLLRPPDSAAANTRAAAMTYATAVGEQRNIPLEDGSSLAINTASQVDVEAFDTSARELRLVRGEALFTVAHDPARPFRVRVGERTVEALGTAFDVRLHAGGAVDVIVTEGRVRLLAGTTATGELHRGQAMRIESDGSTRIATLADQALATRLAWRQGMIVFEQQPLADALEEFSRYTTVRLVVADAATGQRPVGGTIPAGDVASLLEALRINLGLTSVRAADGSIRIGPQR